MLSQLTALMLGALCPSAGTHPAPVYIALSRQAWRQGERTDAQQCLDHALAAQPNSAFVHKEQAILHYNSGKIELALNSTEKALELGDPDPETEVFLARLVAALGARQEAAEKAQGTNTEEGLFVAAALGHEGAGYRLAEYVGEQTERGAMTALVLSGAALSNGQARTASVLAKAARDSAESAASSDLAQAADDLLLRATAATTWRLAASLSSAIEHDTNPSFVASEEFRKSGLRAAFRGRAAAGGPVGPFEVFGSAQLEQHLFLTEREELRSYDIFGVGLNASASLPVSSDPSFVVVGAELRFADVFGDRFGLHYTTELEGGPFLKLRLAPRIGFRLAFHGVITDFIDLSPPDEALSSVNRDRVGQRGLVSMLLRFDGLVWGLDANFFRDDAGGDAFDMIGGTMGTRVVLWPDDGLSLHAGVAVSVREVGPVGDSAVIGPASLRTEFRTALDAGVRFSLFPPFDVVVENRYRHVSARRGHGYSHNVVSLGLEVSW